ncbi:MAG: hypothetical protein ACRD29_15105 [Acidimicrobiales bacterium]
MERVAFLVEETGERIDCLLNPERIEATRLAGVRARGSAAGTLTGTGLADDPLHFTGGGRTELRLDLLFDVDLIDAPTVPVDVRALTRRLWQLAENSSEERGSVRPPLVRLIFGKSWNVPGIVAAIAERFDRFTPSGAPKRSWVRLKLVRVTESAADAEARFEERLATLPPPSAPGATPGSPEEPGRAVLAVGEGEPVPGYSGVRFDLLSTDALGSPFLWRMMAEYNDLDNPLDVPAGTPLAVPPGVATGGAASGVLASLAAALAPVVSAVTTAASAVAPAPPARTTPAPEPTGEPTSEPTP